MIQERWKTAVAYRSCGGAVDHYIVAEELWHKTNSGQESTLNRVISTCLQSARWTSERGSCPAGTPSDERLLWRKSCDPSGWGSRRPWSLLWTCSKTAAQGVKQIPRQQLWCYLRKRARVCAKVTHVTITQRDAQRGGGDQYISTLRHPGETGDHKSERLKLGNEINSREETGRLGLPCPKTFPPPFYWCFPLESDWHFCWESVLEYYAIPRTLERSLCKDCFWTRQELKESRCQAPELGW